MSSDVSSPASASRCARKAIFSGQIELTAGLDGLPRRPITTTGRPYDEARLLVRVSGEPVGFATVSLDQGPISDTTVLSAIERDLGVPVRAELERQGLPELRSLGPNGNPPADAHEGELARRQPGAATVTVIVCTRNRARDLDAGLRSLQRLGEEATELVVVDNAPADERTREVVETLAHEDERFRYVREPRPGLSRARNRGLAEATGEVVAYTDDDVRVDELWVAGLLRGFARREDVACVTGLVASASLERAAEQYFDARVWWSSSCQPQLYDARSGRANAALHPYAAGAFGTGANFAFRTELLRAIGAFDETLGAGSPCAGGEDLDIFVRLLRAGYSISYEPAALVWHEHRVEEEELRRQMYAYGKALSAYLFKYASSRLSALDLLRRLPHGLRHLAVLGMRSTRAGTGTGFARSLVVAETRGLLAGPLAYARARRAQDPGRRRAVAP